MTSIEMSSYQHFTKEQFIEMVEKNFPDNGTFEAIAVITTVKTEKGSKIFQSVTFAKNLKF